MILLLSLHNFGGLKFWPGHGDFQDLKGTLKQI